VSGYDIETRLMARDKGLEGRAGVSGPQSVNLGTGGAYLIPEYMIDAFEVSLATGNPFLKYATRHRVDLNITTVDGTTVNNGFVSPSTVYNLPAINDTIEGEILNENTPLTVGDVSFGVIEFGPLKRFSSKMVRLPVELREDAIQSFEQALGFVLANRIARHSARLFTTGTGAGQPVGMNSAVTVGVTTANQTTIAPSEITNLIYAIDPAYLEQPERCKWMMSPGMLAYVRSLLDSTGKPIFLNDRRLGQTEMLQGYEVVLNSKMAATPTAATTSMYFGRLDKIHTVEYPNVEIRVFSEAAGLAENDLVAFLGIWRVDINLADAGSHPLQQLKQHA
jgi:HK97 family phage major capsid protein